MTNPTEETTITTPGYGTTQGTEASTTTIYKTEPTATKGGYGKKPSAGPKNPTETSSYGSYEYDEDEQSQTEAPSEGETTLSHSYDYETEKPETPNGKQENDTGESGTGNTKQVAGRGIRSGAVGGGSIITKKVPWRKLKSKRNGKKDRNESKPGDKKKSDGRGIRHGFFGGGSILKNPGKRRKNKLKWRKLKPKRRQRRIHEEGDDDEVYEEEEDEYEESSEEDYED